MQESTNIRVYRMTPTQTGMLYYNLLNEEASHYYVQLSFYLEGRVSIPALKEAWQHLIHRHEILRTDFRWREVKYPVQIILNTKEAAFTEYDLTSVSADQEHFDETAHIEAIKTQESKERFHFEEGRLSRLILIRLSEKRYFLLWNFHHILLDGWSLQLIFRDFFTIYHSLITANPLPPAPKAQYSNYLEWLKTQKPSKAQQFWREYLKPLTEPTLLSLGTHSGLTEVITHADELSTLWSEEETTRLTTFCREEQITLNAYIQTVWGILLQKLNRTQISCAGMTVSGRPAHIPFVDEIAGLFINTVPIVIKNRGETGRELVQKVQQEIFEMKDYEHFSLTEMKKLSSISGEDPLFDMIIVVGNLPDNRDLNGVDLGFTIHSNTLHEMTNYDLTVKVNTGSQMELVFLYNRDRYTIQEMEQVLKAFQTLLLNLLADPEKLVTDLQLISPTEQRNLLQEIYQSSHTFPDKLVHTLFLEQVRNQPEQTLHCDNEQLTYAELNCRSNQIARHLRELGVGPDVPVGLMVGRSLQIFVGILAILKAGGCYVPLDPQYPAERIQYMLDDTGAKIVLTEGEIAQTLQYTGTVLDLTDTSYWTGEETPLPDLNRPEHLVYIIHTSGSTGQPKGVMIEHGALANFCYGAQELLALQPGQTIISVTSISFDIFLFESLYALAMGLRIVVATDLEQITPELFSRAVIEHQVEIIQTTPSRMQLLMSDEKGLLGLRDMKVILLIGEVFPLHLLERLKQLTDAQIFNLYGPTEATIWCTLKDLTQDQQIDIGKPLPNYQLFVLDKDEQMVPKNWPGEIYISGPGLARGYWGKPELTARAFRPNPYQHGQYLYRTGDLGIWQDDGNYQFRGRRDHQTKIKGYRIELEEIEYYLGKYDLVRKAVVVPTPDHKALVAYLVIAGELAVQPLRTYLNKHLPEYMIPAYYVKMEAIPYLPNGKVNRKALPAPETTLALGVKYVEPRNEVEKHLALIWQEILQGNPVGIYDDFFDLGGDSIQAIQVIARANQQAINLSVKDLISYRTIARLTEEMLKPNLAAASAEVQTVRVYNKRYRPDHVYPYYFNCFLGNILEKMNYERNYQLDKGYLLVAAGNSVLVAGYAVENDVKQIQYRDFPYQNLLDFPDHLTRFGLTVEIKSFESLEDSLAYCRERLARQEIIIFNGTTYFLNYTKDYYADQTVWLKEMDAKHAMLTGQGHILMLIDITETSYVVYDSTFNYFGEVPKDDFEKTFQGIKAIEFMAGHPLYESAKPYTIFEVNTENLPRYDWLEVGKEIIQMIVKETLEPRTVKFDFDGYQAIAYFGMAALAELRDLTQRTEKGETDFRAAVNYFTEIFRAFEYKYIFLRDFLQDFQKICPLDRDIIRQVQHYINQYYNLYLDCEKIKLSTNEAQKNAFLVKTKQRLIAQIEQERQFYENLGKAVH